ncbi:MAG: glycosyltransferase [Planctomycetia bacterium]|nr:glycosyltransferase [Planctomycetia bacterium]
MEKRKIALCITEMNPGGAEKAMMSLATRLDREKFDPVLYVLRPEKYHDPRSWIPAIREAGIPIVFLDISGPISLVRGILRLKKYLKRQKPDLIQSFLFHANLVGRIAGRLAGVPIVCSGIRVSERSSRWQLLIDRKTQRLADSYIAVSRSCAEYTAEQGIDPQKIRIIANGIDLAENDFPLPGEKNGKNTVSDLIFPSDSLNFLFVGRFTEQKGLDWLFDTLPFWFEREKIDLWMVGDGPDRQKLTDRANQLSCSGRIHFCGWRPDISALMKKSDLLLLPSRWEGMPNVVLEAMKAALPVFASNTDGVAELLGENIEPQSFPFGDKEIFLEKIRILIENPDLRIRLGKENQKRISAHFNIFDKVREYEDHWTALCEKEDHR